MKQVNGISDIRQLEAAIRDLEFDYMRGLVSEEDYKKRMADLNTRLVAAGGTPRELPSAPKVVSSQLRPTRLLDKKTLVDPVTAVRRTVESMRRIPIERIAQEAGVPTHIASKVLADLLDGRELSGRLDHDSGDFILGTGTGPAPKTIAVCPYCRYELKRIAVKGETITCSMCRESFVVV
ncbi:MAG: hypothetical protein HXY34_04405 [Candidatus Thorarchaeota archaeon]|nr:hypothetical protein [Candidatus Thorarchaeota archaeon]